MGLGCTYAWERVRVSGVVDVGVGARVRVRVIVFSWMDRCPALVFVCSPSPHERIVHTTHTCFFLPMLPPARSARNTRRSYQKVEVECLAEDGRRIRAIILSEPKRLSFEPLPSLRYLSLLREGAADYDLPAAYRQKLADLPHYEAPVLPRVLGFMIGLPLIFAYSLIGLVLNLVSTSTLFASIWFHYTRVILWAIYWGLLYPLVGSGHNRSRQPPWLFSARAFLAMLAYAYAWWVGCGWLATQIRLAVLGGDDGGVD